MASLIDDGIIQALEDQVNSGCISKELFAVQIQLMRDLCTNFDTQQIATNATLIDLQNQITLCCAGGGGGTGTGDTISECGSINSVSADTSQYSDCNVWVDATLIFTGTNGDDNSGVSGSRSGDVVVYCGNTEIGRQAYSLFSGNLGNNQSFTDSASFSFTGLSCTGVITVVTENTSGGGPSGGTSTFTQNACINANCV